MPSYSKILLSLLLLWLFGCSSSDTTSKTPQAQTLSVETTINQAVAITLSGTAGEAGGLLSFTLLSQPDSGSLSGAAPNLSYTPNSGFRGSDSFTYRVNDGVADSDAATVTIAVVNQAPSAAAQTLSGYRNQPLSITLSGSDPEADPLTYRLTQMPANGSVTVTSPIAVYTPDAGFVGSDQFGFVANDGDLDSTQALVTVTVTNRPPVAEAQTVIAARETVQSITLTGSDPDGDPLTYEVIGTTSRGVLSGQAPNLTYTPNVGFVGDDILSFRVSDGLAKSEIVAMTITVNCAVPSLNAVYDYFNQVRQQAGMIPMTRNLTIEQAAQNHADYLLINDAFGHDEDPLHSGFTGATPSDRGLAAGYMYRWLSENVAGGQTPQQAIDYLMVAIYHRFGILDFHKDETGLGFGMLPNQCLHSFVNDNGNSQLNYLCTANTYTSGPWYFDVCADPNHQIPTASYLAASTNVALQNPDYVLWPADSSTGTSPIFAGGETPAPLPDTMLPAGYPVSIQFNPESYPNGVSVSSFKLYNAAGTELTNTHQLDQNSDPNGLFDAYQYALYSLDVLADNSQYSARVIFSDNGVPQPAITWSFTTGAQ